MKQILLLLVCCLPFSSYAQKEYSYFNDKVFNYSVDLFGYTFIPYKGKLSNAHFEDPIKLGLVQLKITSSTATIIERVDFSTSGIKGENKSEPYKMSVAQINKTGWGYDLTITDIKNYNIQGYLKVFISKGYVTKILFRPEMAATERTYYLPPPPGHIEVRDSKFYTHEQDMNAKSFDLLIDQTIFPFAYTKDELDYREFSRLYPDDRVSFKIEERMILKGKKEKPVTYIILNDGGNKTTPKREFVLKKIKDGYRYPDRIMKKDRESIELSTVDNVTKEDVKFYFYRNSQKKLTSIRIGEIEYTMRAGKRNDN